MSTNTPVPDRSLKLTGASNFRDLGGYVGLDGRSVRWRRLFRSDHLAALTDDDVAALSTLGLTRVCDLRGVRERAQAACRLPGVVVHSLPIEPVVINDIKAWLDSGRPLTAPDTVGLMHQTYRAFVHDNAVRFAELFDHLLDNDAPLVFHCTAGKDRTGFAAALILLALGVPRPVVAQDYLLTNALYQMPQFTASFAPEEVLRVLWGVQESFLNEALHAVDADFGGVARYLEQALGLGPKEQARLAALYLSAA
jgi:protein-tyrosine phosphatase